MKLTVGSRQARSVNGDREAVLQRPVKNEPVAVKAGLENQTDCCTRMVGASTIAQNNDPPSSLEDSDMRISPS